MIMHYLGMAITIISVAAPLFGLAFNFYASHVRIKLSGLQLIDLLEKEIEKQPNRKLAELNREKLVRLRFKQAVGYSENIRALRKLFCDERNKLSVSRFLQ